MDSLILQSEERLGDLDWIVNCREAWRMRLMKPFYLLPFLSVVICGVLSVAEPAEPEWQKVTVRLFPPNMNPEQRLAYACDEVNSLKRNSEPQN
jgi:hypothetical protein